MGRSRRNGLMKDGSRGFFSVVVELNYCNNSKRKRRKEKEKGGGGG